MTGRVTASPNPFGVVARATGVAAMRISEVRKALDDETYLILPTLPDSHLRQTMRDIRIALDELMGMLTHASAVATDIEEQEEDPDE